MGQDLRIEDPQRVDFNTTRTQNCRLWFVNNRELEYQILAGLAKYQKSHNVALYAFTLQGDHHHDIATFKLANRACFMRDLNSHIARVTKRLVPAVGGGKFWGRRYANQRLPRDEDTEEWLFYCALQPVLAGLTEKISEYPGYNSFHDAVCGIKRKFKLTDWTAYHNAKRYNPQVPIKNYQTTFTLEYKRLPGYEHLSQGEYKRLMYERLEARRVEIVKKRYAEGKGFLGKAAVLATKPGDRPHSPKTSGRNSKRPLVLSRCAKTIKHYVSEYFGIRARYKEASFAYLRQGILTTAFPQGTYRPPMLCAPGAGP